MDENPIYETLPMDSFEEPIFDEPAKPKRSPVIWFVLAFVLLVAMAGAAFVGGQMLTQQFGLRLPGLSPVGGLVGPGGPGMAQMSVAIQMTPAPELPTRRADLSGMYVSRDGNNITLAEASEGPVSKTGPDAMAQGPKVEVIVTADTQVYRDVTQPPQIDSAQASQEFVLVQMVELQANADEIGDNFMLQVWGERRGDRIIAEVILYMEPMMISIDNGMPPPDQP